MRTRDVVAATGVSIKALRYYESLGLLRPARLANGYRDDDEHDLPLVERVSTLAAAGVTARLVRPFLDCLHSAHTHADDRPASLATYHALIEELTERIDALTAQRDVLRALLSAAAHRGGERTPTMTLFEGLPERLPEPHDDGAAGHLLGRGMPALRLPSTSGAVVDLAGFDAGRTIIYVYPLTGRPDVDLPEGWDAIPGARGCTGEACGFRDYHVELLGAGAGAVYGLSQDTDYQTEVVDRLGLPFAMLSDPNRALAEALALPKFSASGLTLYARLTLVVTDGVVEHVFYPVFPPQQHAGEVLAWLRGCPTPETGAGATPR